MKPERQASLTLGSSSVQKHVVIPLRFLHTNNKQRRGMKKLQHTSHFERAENDAGHKHEACKSDAHLFDENRRRESH